MNVSIKQILVCVALFIGGVAVGVAGAYFFIPKEPVTNESLTESAHPVQVDEFSHLPDTRLVDELPPYQLGEGVVLDVMDEDARKEVPLAMLKQDFFRYYSGGFEGVEVYRLNTIHRETLQKYMEAWNTYRGPDGFDQSAPVTMEDLSRARIYVSCGWYKERPGVITPERRTPGTTEPVHALRRVIGQMIVPEEIGFCNPIAIGATVHDERGSVFIYAVHAD